MFKPIEFFCQVRERDIVLDPSQIVAVELPPGSDSSGLLRIVTNGMRVDEYYRVKADPNVIIDQWVESKTAGEPGALAPAAGQHYSV